MPTPMHPTGILGSYGPGGDAWIQNFLAEVKGKITQQGDFENLISQRATQENFNGFLPNEQVYTSALNAQIEDIFSRLPVARENYEADLASRGIRGSGEATKYLYSDVYAPIARQAAIATTQAKMAYFQAFQTGSIASANLNFNYMQLKSQRELEKARIKAEADASMFETIGGVVGTVAGAVL